MIPAFHLFLILESRCQQLDTLDMRIIGMTDSATYVSNMACWLLPSVPASRPKYSPGVYFF